jgi:hypothetical protein
VATIEMMEKDTLTPQLSKAEARKLAQQHETSAEGKEALEAGRAIRGGDFSVEPLRTIYIWKTGGRGKSRLERNSEAEIKEALHLASIAKEPRSAIAVLVGLSGVDVPVASAILTAMYPKKYTILDFRALEALGNRTKDRSLRFYLSYLRYCIELARKWGMPLRDLDHALWDWSKHRKKKSRWQA